jgi:hypothetical protein
VLVGITHIWTTSQYVMADLAPALSSQLHQQSLGL